MWVVLTIAAAVLLMFAGQLLRVRIFNALIAPYGVVGVRRILSGHFLGFTLNAIVPFRLGDGARALFLSRGTGISFGVVAPAVAIERLLDVSCLGLALAAVGVWRSAWIPLCLGLGLATFGVATLAAGVAGTRAADARVHRALVRASAHLPAQSRSLAFLWLAVRVFQRMSPRRWVLVIGLTVAVWVTYAVAFGALALGVGNLIDAWLGASVSQAWAPPFLALFASDDALLVFVVLALPMCLLGLAALFMRTSGGPVAEIVRGAPRAAPRTGNEVRREDSRCLSRLPGLDSPLEQLDRDATWDGSDAVRQLYGGSGARVWVMERAGLRFVRKVVASPTAERLRQQADFLAVHAIEYGFPSVDSYRELPRVAILDMEYLADGVGVDSVIRADPAAADLIDQVWERFVAPRSVSRRSDLGWAVGVQRLWADKVEGNYRLICDLIPDFASPNGLRVNERHLPNLGEIIDAVRPLYESFPPTLATPYVHGDLTLSNLLVVGDGGAQHLRALDPNPSQGVVALEIDIGKLLQSAHGGYELLHGASLDPYDGKTIRYEMDPCPGYERADERLKELVRAQYGDTVWVAARLQCFIHFMRLLPYRIAFDRRRVGIYYARTLEMGYELLCDSPPVR